MAEPAQKHGSPAEFAFCRLARHNVRLAVISDRTRKDGPDPSAAGSGWQTFDVTSALAAPRSMRS